MKHNRKGGARVARQNFSMHPDLVKTIIHVTNQMNTERVDRILQDRQQRVTYSKVVASLAWLLKTRYLTPEGELTDDLRQLIADYETTSYEQPDDEGQPDGEDPALSDARPLAVTGEDAVEDQWADGDAALQDHPFFIHWGKVQR